MGSVATGSFFRRLKVLSILAISMTTMACQNFSAEQKYDWSATLSAPEEYPVQAYAGAIIAEGYQQSLAGFGDADDGWGNASGYVVMGPDTKNLPDRLQVSWHSFVDQKNYEGAWELPKDAIAQLFAEGFIDHTTKKKRTYTTFVIGLAPNGLVVVWLSGDGNQVEVAHFKAQETLVDIDHVSDDNRPVFSKKYNDVVLSQLNDEFNTFERIRLGEYPSPDLYEQFRQRYLWRPVVALPEDYQLDSFVLHTYNGEVEITSSDNQDRLFDYQKRGLLKGFFFSWRDVDNVKVATCWLEDFDQAEVMRAYANFSPSDNVDLIVTGVGSPAISLALRGGDKEIEINTFKATIE